MYLQESGIVLSLVHQVANTVQKQLVDSYNNHSQQKTDYLMVFMLRSKC